MLFCGPRELLAPKNITFVIHQRVFQDKLQSTYSVFSKDPVSIHAKYQAVSASLDEGSKCLIEPHYAQARSIPVSLTATVVQLRTRRCGTGGQGTSGSPPCAPNERVAVDLLATATAYVGTTIERQELRLCVAITAVSLRKTWRYSVDLKNAFRKSSILLLEQLTDPLVRY
jgi:hypothetical protein